MKYIDWDDNKNDWLILNRNVSFEICEAYIIAGRILAIIDNHSPYEHQKVFILDIDGYAYRIPFVEDDEKIFLKTAYPSRVDTKKYLQDNNN